MNCYKCLSVSVLVIIALSERFGIVESACGMKEPDDCMGIDYSDIESLLNQNLEDQCLRIPASRACLQNLDKRCERRPVRNSIARYMEKLRMRELKCLEKGYPTKDSGREKVDPTTDSGNQKKTGGGDGNGSGTMKPQYVSIAASFVPILTFLQCRM